MKSMSCLYLFIEKYKNIDLEEIFCFVSGMEKDLMQCISQGNK